MHVFKQIRLVWKGSTLYTLIRIYRLVCSVFSHNAPFIVNIYEYASCSKQTKTHITFLHFFIENIGAVYASAMVTSTSTPGSMLMEVICLTISDGLWRSMSRLWILIWKRSQVLDPSPQGVFLVVMRRVYRRNRDQVKTTSY